MGYDKTYKDVKNVFGSEPEDILLKNFESINKAKPILDIGAGQGRNSIFLAENGYQVEALEPSIVAIETLNEISKEKKLSIQALHSGFENFHPQTDYYSAILVFGLIQILSRDNFAKLLSKLKEWTTEGSFIFITAFGTADASYKRYSTNWLPSSRNVFTDRKGNYRRFLEPGEILYLFDGFEVFHHWEGEGKEHHHGDGVPEKHYMVEAVFKK